MSHLWNAVKSSCEEGSRRDAQCLARPCQWPGSSQSARKLPNTWRPAHSQTPTRRRNQNDRFASAGKRRLHNDGVWKGALREGRCHRGRARRRGEGGCLSSHHFAKLLLRGKNVETSECCVGPNRTLWSCRGRETNRITREVHRKAKAMRRNTPVPSRLKHLSRGRVSRRSARRPFAASRLFPLWHASYWWRHLITQQYRQIRGSSSTEYLETSCSSTPSRIASRITAEDLCTSHSDLAATKTASLVWTSPNGPPAPLYTLSTSTGTALPHMDSLCEFATGGLSLRQNINIYNVCSGDRSRMAQKVTEQDYVCLVRA